ncbi:hypothetical protein EMPS_03916 [Entomortierella parvispora]|uniref:Uncharacterized protein n=1 Tax=Entomortierella parvispora TaxID=205924 RepID=A0A9P3H7N9_9FUNG|nr:hypothetical protein EMPS_03916 [Entomortierella parvispora]
MRSSKLFAVLVALIVLAYHTSVAQPHPTQGEVMSTLVIDVGSSAARLGVLVGANGLAFGDTGEPKIIWTGPGTHSSPGPLESNWTAEGYVLIKDGTDEAHYVHPFNTLFNLDHPIELRSKHDIHYHSRPDLDGHQAFTLIEMTTKYLQQLITYAESVIGRITLTVVVSPHGRNIRTAGKLSGNFTSYHQHEVDGLDSKKTEMPLMRAVISLPVYRQFMIYNRASAAIFPFDNGMEYGRAFLVYRLGSSTLEVSVHKVEGGELVTMSSVYNQHLGGNNFNQRVVNWLLQAHKNKTGQDLFGDDSFLLRLKAKVEMAKQVLSIKDWVLIEVEPLQSGGQGLSEVLTRSQFEDINMDLFTKAIMAIDEAINGSTLYTKSDVQDVVFSGGSTNIPLLQSTIRDHFGPHTKYHGLHHPETTVVLGAGKLGHWYQDERHYDGETLCASSTLRATFGIEIAGGVMFKYRGGETIVNEMYTFSTTKDYQDRVVIRVFRGVGKWTNQNTFLGGIELTGIAPAPKGVPQIRVRLTTSIKQYVNLSVMDVDSGRINATIFASWKYGNDFYGMKSDYEFMEVGAFEVEPAGRLSL